MPQYQFLQWSVSRTKLFNSALQTIAVAVVPVLFKLSLLTKLCLCSLNIDWYQNCACASKYRHMLKLCQCYFNVICRGNYACDLLTLTCAETVPMLLATLAGVETVPVLSSASQKSKLCMCSSTFYWCWNSTCVLLTLVSELCMCSSIFYWCWNSTCMLLTLTGVKTVHVLFYFVLMLKLYMRASNFDWCRNYACALLLSTDVGTLPVCF